MSRSLLISRSLLLILLVLPAACNPAKPGNTKVVVLAIDGLSWNVIQPMLNNGELETFGSLMDNGSYGTLNVPEWESSPVLWTTMATGRPRQYHGIDGWYYFDAETRSWMPTESTARKLPAIWNILSGFNRTEVIIDWPVTSPPEQINGIMITRFNSIEHMDIYPHDRRPELESLLSSAVYDNSHPDPWVNSELSGFARWKLLTSAYLRESPDLLASYLQTADGLQHRLWKYYEPELFVHPVWGIDEENIKAYGQVIPGHYRDIDGYIGSLRAGLDEHTVLIIISDHGLRPVPSPTIKKFDINRILQKGGLLSLNAAGDIDYNRSSAYECGTAEEDIKVCLNPDYLKDASRLSHVIDSVRVGGIRPLMLMEAEDSYAVVRNLLFRTSLPEQMGTIEVLSHDYNLSGFITLSFSGGHDNSGVIFMSGPNLKKNVHLRNASQFDVLPTVLYILGLPVAEDMEGQVLTEAFDAAYLEKNPVRFIASYGKRSITPDLASSDMELIDKLRSVGYV
ncbi:MAG: alkaline phosphatase family protein [archaeon]